MHSGKLCVCVSPSPPCLNVDERGHGDEYGNGCLFLVGESLPWGTKSFPTLRQGARGNWKDYAISTRRVFDGTGSAMATNVTRVLFSGGVVSWTDFIVSDEKV